MAFRILWVFFELCSQRVAMTNPACLILTLRRKLKMSGKRVPFQLKWSEAMTSQCYRCADKEVAVWRRVNILQNKLKTFSHLLKRLPVKWEISLTFQLMVQKTKQNKLFWSYSNPFGSHDLKILSWFIYFFMLLWNKAKSTTHVFSWENVINWKTTFKIV